MFGSGIFRRLAFLLVLVVTSNVFAESRPSVFVSILPQKYFVERVADGLVDVNVMVGPGQNPATYEPTPRQMAAIASADIYFSIGVPFESAWLNTISANNKQLRMVDCCDQFADDIPHSEHVHRHGEHEVADPHIWTNPLKVIAMTRLLEEELSRLDPENAQRYKAAAQRFIRQLDELDSYIRAETSVLEKRVLIVTHPSWSYFANEYGFQQISIEQNGEDVQAASLTRLVQQAREQKIKVVFDQPQFYNKAARVLASEIGARIITLDPLAFDYLANMRESTRLIAQGLSVE